MKTRIAVLSLIAAVLVTLATGLVNTTPNILGATWYGWPLAWLYVIVYPGSPWFINWTNFAVDTVLWFIMAFAVLIVLFRRR